jgi:tetratricopeptide (TPR) repeat protein
MDNVNQSLSIVKKKSYEEYKEWLDNNLRLHKNTTIFLFNALDYFINNYSSDLAYEKYYYIEKLYYMCLELKLIDYAKRQLKEIVNEFTQSEPKVKRMIALIKEVDSKEDIDSALNIYKSLIKSNQEDRSSIKRYLALYKAQLDLESLKKYTEFWNEYLKVYMDDIEAWYELCDVYLFTNNYNKAIFCLEEILLHQPHNYKVYIKLGDVLSTMNNSEAAIMAIKYYSQSVLIKPTPRALWGLVYTINIVKRVNKDLDEKQTNLVKIAEKKLKELYKNTPFNTAVTKLFSN